MLLGKNPEPVSPRELRMTARQWSSARDELNRTEVSVSVEETPNKAPLRRQHCLQMGFNYRLTFRRIESK